MTPLDHRPSEFYIRTYDLFAILIPGLVFVMIAFGVAWEKWTRAAIVSLNCLGMSEAWLAGGILLVGFVSGHIIEGIGSLLDDIEWRISSTLLAPHGFLARLLNAKKWLQVVHSVVATFVPLLREFGVQREEISADLCRAFPRRRITFKNSRQWALVYLSKHAPHEVNYLIEQKDAQRKGVRNIAILALLMFLCPSIRHFGSGEAPKWFALGNHGYLLLALVIATWQRHSQLQWKYSQLVFDHFTAYYAYSHCEVVDQDAHG